MTCLNQGFNREINLPDRPLKPLSLAYTRNKSKNFTLRIPFGAVNNDLARLPPKVKIALRPETL